MSDFSPTHAAAILQAQPEQSPSTSNHPTAMAPCLLEHERAKIISTHASFPQFASLPVELHVKIWQMAYDTIPTIPVCPFELRPVTRRVGGEDKTCLTLTPAKELGDLTREFRSLRSVNVEARCEGRSYFDNNLRFVGTKPGSDSLIDINFPWCHRSIFCFNNHDVFATGSLASMDTSMIENVFDAVRRVGFSVGCRWTSAVAAETMCSEIAFLLARFHRPEGAMLATDKLAGETGHEAVDKEIGSSSVLESWDDRIDRLELSGFRDKLYGMILGTQGILQYLEVFRDVINEHAGSDDKFRTLLDNHLTHFGILYKTSVEPRYCLYEDDFRD